MVQRILFIPQDTFRISFQFFFIVLQQLRWLLLIMMMIVNICMSVSCENVFVAIFFFHLSLHHYFCYQMRKKDKILWKIYIEIYYIQLDALCTYSTTYDFDFFLLWFMQSISNEFSSDDVTYVHHYSHTL